MPKLGRKTDVDVRDSETKEVIVLIVYKNAESKNQIRSEEAIQSYRYR